jgi:hypothetical protein
MLKTWQKEKDKLGAGGDTHTHWQKERDTDIELEDSKPKGHLLLDLGQIQLSINKYLLVTTMCHTFHYIIEIQRQTRHTYSRGTQHKDGRSTYHQL